MAGESNSPTPIAPALIVRDAMTADEVAAFPAVEGTPRYPMSNDVVAVEDASGFAASPSEQQERSRPANDVDDAGCSSKDPSRRNIELIDFLVKKAIEACMPTSSPAP